MKQENNQFSEMRWLSSFNQVLENELHRSELTTEILAKRMHASKRQFHRKVKTLTGKTPRNYLKEARFRRAYDYLKNRTYHSVRATAYAVGFEDEVYFARQFRMQYGILPSELYTK